MKFLYHTNKNIIHTYIYIYIYIYINIYIKYQLKLKFYNTLIKIKNIKISRKKCSKVNPANLEI